VLALAAAAAGCGGENLPPPRWERVEGATVSQRRFTPQGEHFLGRAVAAQILGRYGYDADPAARKYLALIGTYLVYANDLPVTYKGYRFGVLATREIRAFSTPGGTVFLSRGLLDAVRSEEELAGVLAHELGHLENKDGINSVGRSKATSLLTAVGTLAASFVGGGGVAAALLQTFEGAVDHAVTDLVNKGYSRSQEVAADAAAVRILRGGGYPVGPYLAFSRRTFAAGGEQTASLLSTHPGSAERLQELERLAGKEPAPAPAAPARDRRFVVALRAAR
jgi:predicted Zn-dependent protease